MYEQKNRPFSFEPVGLKLFIIRLCQLWEDEQADYCRMFESIRGLGEDKANNTRVFRKVTNSFLSDWYAKLKEFISDAKTGLIEIQNNKDNKKPAQLLDEILSFDTKEVETYLEKYKDQNTLDTSVMSPFSAFIITQWDKIANLHEYFARQSGCVFISDLDKLSNMKLNVEDRKSLTLLMGFFENASNRFPAVKHTVISWPFVCEMPCPPNENVQDFCKGEKKLTMTIYIYVP